jgi:hypothetical protein
MRPPTPTDTPGAWDEYATAKEAAYVSKPSYRTGVLETNHIFIRSRATTSPEETSKFVFGKRQFRFFYLKDEMRGKGGLTLELASKFG